MKNKALTYICVCLLGFGLTGCLVRAYSTTKERVDQEVAGNKGFIKGSAPKTEGQKKTSRKTYVVEMEMGAPKVSPMVDVQQPPQEETTKEEVPAQTETVTPISSIPEIQPPAEEVKTETQEPKLTQYKVEQGDTLQKISKKFYGSYSKWTKIYEANKDVLKNPNAIKPGQVINIPQE